MIRGERTWQLDLDGLRCTERGVQACALPGDCLVSLVYLVRQENGLGLTVRAEGNRRRRRTLTAKASEYARKPLPDLGQRMHLDHNRISHVLSVLKLVQICYTGIRPGVGPDFHDRDRLPGKNRGQTVVIM
ncbi:MAG TPA: hypothetical protein VK599_00975, partial [Streptosporangiaceae bacterium]|nr:hypothetical protein [Streptosporangiaceae bacterium]